MVSEHDLRNEWNSLFDPVVVSICNLQPKCVHKLVMLVYSMGKEFEKLNKGINEVTTSLSAKSSLESMYQSAQEELKPEDKENKKKSELTTLILSQKLPLSAGDNNSKMCSSPDLFETEKAVFSKPIFESPKLNKRKKTYVKNKNIAPRVLKMEPKSNETSFNLKTPKKKLKKATQKTPSPCVSNLDDTTIVDSSPEPQQRRNILNCFKEKEKLFDCAVCNKIGKHCSRHQIYVPTQPHCTFPGFWDLKFTNDEPNEEPNTDMSTILM